MFDALAQLSSRELRCAHPPSHDEAKQSFQFQEHASRSDSSKEVLRRFLKPSKDHSGTDVHLLCHLFSAKVFFLGHGTVFFPKLQFHDHKEVVDFAMLFLS